MRIFLFLAILFISLSFLYKAISFVVFQYQLSKNKVLVLKHPGYKFFNKYHFFGGVAALIAGVIFYKMYEFEYIILLWSILAITQLLNSFISPSGYLILSTKGFRKRYNEKLLRWELIKKLEFNGSEIAFYYGKKMFKSQLSPGQSISMFSNKLKEQRKDIYDKLFES